MKKVTLSITTTTLTRKGSNFWFPAEFTVPDNLNADEVLPYVWSIIAEDGGISCTRLDCPPGPTPDAPRRVLSRTPIALTKDAISMISPVHFEVVP